MSTKNQKRTAPRTPPGFTDAFGDDLLSRQEMIETILGVYRRFGFAPLETSAMEYLDVLGKYLPESDEPEGGVFALKDDDNQWISLRYDLTAPLSRVVAQYGNALPSPYRRYQVGPVWRREKPGPGRFRQFYQCDFDTVGTSEVAADAEVCAVFATSLEALGIDPEDFEVRVNNRKVLTGVLETIGMSPSSDRQMTVLRAIDKLDRLGLDGVRELLGEGRKDASGDFTEGAGLTEPQIETVMGFVGAGVGAKDRDDVCDRLGELVGTSEVGQAGVDELKRINALLETMGLSKLVAGDDPRADRTMRVERLAQGHGLSLELPVPDAHVVHDQVAGNELAGTLAGHVAAAPADHEAELPFVVTNQDTCLIGTHAEDWDGVLIVVDIHKGPGRWRRLAGWMEPGRITA